MSTPPPRLTPLCYPPPNATAASHPSNQDGISTLVTGLVRRLCAGPLLRPADRPLRYTCIERLVLVKAAPVGTTVWTLQLPQLHSFTATLTSTLVFYQITKDRNIPSTIPLLVNRTVHFNEPIQSAIHVIDWAFSFLFLLIENKPLTKFHFIICTSLTTNLQYNYR